MTTGKTIALTRGTFVSKVMSLLFNMLSRCVIVFLPMSKCFSNIMIAVTICYDFRAQENRTTYIFFLNLGTLLVIGAFQEVSEIKWTT